MSGKKQALGKGLGALLENANTDITSKYNSDKPTTVGNISNIVLEQIEANPFQPRTRFEEDALNELAESIKKHGIIQPLTVRKLGYDKYQLISGERRYKASQLAGLKEVPAYIRIANDQAMLEMALVENIQRENLDAIEIALSYKRLIDECKLTQEELSSKVGKQRSTVTNYLRLLKLPPVIQLGIRENKISMGHARALININDNRLQQEIFDLILDNDLSVRQVEELARSQSPASRAKKSSPKKNQALLSFEHQKINDDLASYFETKVSFKRQNNGKGKIVIPFESDDDLTRILKLLDI